MAGNDENTRAEGTFGRETAKTEPKMPEKHINTRVEEISGKEERRESETERECGEKITRFLGYLQEFWGGENQADERLEIMLELSEAITRNLKEIQRARLDAQTEERREGKWKETLEIPRQGRS